MNRLSRSFLPIGFALVFLYVAVLLYAYRNSLFVQQSAIEWTKQYNSSKYVMGERGSGISDDIVYAYAGYAYLNGTLPTTVNFEHPPLAKYAFGLSQQLFGNPSWAVALFFVVWMTSFVVLVNKTIKSFWLKLLSIGLVFGNSLVFGFFVKTMLDVPLAAMQMLSVAVYLWAVKKKTVISAVVFGVVLGLAMGTKYPIPMTATLAVILLGGLYYHQRRWKLVVIAGVSAACAYLLLYLPVFFAGTNPIDFLRFEYWRFRWFGGKLDAPKGLILKTILFGQHEAWWEGGGAMAKYEKYMILWPVSFGLFLLSFFKKINLMDVLTPYKVWALVAFLFLMLGASNDFYLIPLMPVFVLFGVGEVERILSRHKLLK